MTYRLIYTFLLLFLVSCQNHITTEPPLERLSVLFNVSGDYLIEEEYPMSSSTRATTNDILAIQVYQRTNDKGSKYKPYAYGLWDNQDRINIQLNKGLLYRLEVTVIPDAKLLIASSTIDNAMMQPLSVYGSGGDSRVNNNFIYSTINYLPYLSQGTSAIIEGKSHSIYARPLTDRYYGEMSEILAAESLTTIQMLTKRVSFGLKYNIIGFVGGIVKVQLKNAPEIVLTPTDYVNRRSIITMQGSTFEIGSWVGDNYTESIPLVVYWEKSTGSEVKVVNQETVFKRKTMYILTIDLTQTQSNGGLDIGFEEGGMENGGDI